MKCTLKNIQRSLLIKTPHRFQTSSDVFYLWAADCHTAVWSPLHCQRALVGPWGPLRCPPRTCPTALDRRAAAAPSLPTTIRITYLQLWKLAFIHGYGFVESLSVSNELKVDKKKCIHLRYRKWNKYQVSTRTVLLKSLEWFLISLSRASKQSNFL